MKEKETNLSLSFDEISYLYSALLEDLENKINLSSKEDIKIINAILEKIIKTELE